MPRFLIDTSVLITNPQVLAKAGPSGIFLIPAAVLRELRGGSSRTTGGQQLLKLVEEATSRGGVQILDETIEGHFREPRTASADIAITIHMARAKEHGDDLILATEDRDLVRAAAELGIPVVDTAGLVTRLAAAPITNQPLLDQAQALVRVQRRSLVRGVALGVAASVLANIVAGYITVILSTINVWGTLILLTTLALCLYWFRGWNRLMYGSAEFFVGFSASVRVFWPRFVYTELNATDILQVVAGLYVMVRGLDNVDKALTGTRWEAAWRRVFKQ